MPSFRIMAFKLVRGLTNHSAGLLEDAQDIFPLHFLQRSSAGDARRVLSYFRQGRTQADAR